MCVGLGIVCVLVSSGVSVCVGRVKTYEFII